MTVHQTPSSSRRPRWWPWQPKQEKMDLPIKLAINGWQGGRLTPRADIGMDQYIIWITVALLAWGMVMVYSTTIAMPDNPRFANYSAYHFVIRHCLAIGVGLIAAVLVFQIPVKTWQRWAPFLFVSSLVLLILVLIPFIGKGVNGARRWISFGVFNFQPSEFVKVTILLYSADYMVRRMDITENFFKAVMPMVAALTVVGMLLLAEPDAGAFIVIVVIAMGILFLGGVNAKMFFSMLVVVIISFIAIIWVSPWRRQRIFAYLNPFSEEYALDKGYQLTHSLIAFGRGEYFGVGLGGSVEKLHWLPEAHTDFMLAVIGEEFGLMGVLILIILFLWLTRRIVEIGRQAIILDKVFSGLMVQGVALWIGFQALINIGVNLGAFPTKGLTLPFMSYGGSAILMNLIVIAIALRVDYENRQIMRGRDR